MTGVKAYESYKYSTIPWLELIPSDWSESRLGYETWVRARLGWKGLKAEEYVDEGVAFLSTPNIRGGCIDFDDVNFISDDRYEESPEIKLAIDDVLLAKDGSTLGTVNVVRNLPRPATVNSSIALLTPGKRCNGRYLKYLIQSELIQRRIELLKGGMGVPHLFQDDIRRISIPFPDLSTQARIVDYLDRETFELDDLVGKQERLIELLAEKRQAVITRAVTKGLDPAAPTKPSGVPWRGDVPGHWSLPKLKNCCHIKRGRFMHRPRNAPHLYDGEYPFIQTGAIARAQGKYVTDHSQTLSEAGLATSAMMPQGTLVMAIAANIGDVAILSFDSCAPDSVLGFQPTSQANTDFLYYALTAKREELTSEAPVTSQGNLNVERVGSVTVPLPPVEEQVEIVKTLDNRLAQMSHTATKASAMKRLLLERRSALISAAVTGKIDVRKESF